MSNEAYIYNSTTNNIFRYTGWTCTDSQDIQAAIENLKNVMIPNPEYGTRVDDAVDQLILTQEVDAYIKIQTAYGQEKK